MNRLKVLSIIKELIELYIQNNMNYQTSMLVIKNLKEEEFSEDLVAIKESEIISFILSCVPYYQINLFLQKFLKSFNNLNLNKESDIALLVSPYLEELSVTINYRINTEVRAHIKELLNRYIYDYEFESIHIAQILFCNIVLPENNVVCDNYDNKQEKLFEIIKEDTTRESISKNSYNERRKYLHQIKKILLNIGEKSFENFESIIFESINKFLLTDSETGIELVKLYQEEFNELKIIYKSQTDKGPVRQLSLFDNN